MLPVVNEIGELYNTADGGAMATLIAKLAIEKSYQSKLEETRNAIQVCFSLWSPFPLWPPETVVMLLCFQWNPSQSGRSLISSWSSVLLWKSKSLTISAQVPPSIVPQGEVSPILYLKASRIKFKAVLGF